MSGYRRFIAYVYEYRKGKKESNCGFVKVEVRNQRCTMELHLRCPCLAPDIRCRIYGFVRKDGLMNGIFLGSCMTGIDGAQCAIETDSANMGGSGISLTRLGGMVILTEAGGFFGTQWDEQNIRPENFREIKIPDPGEQVVERKAPEQQRHIKQEEGQKEMPKGEIPKGEMPKGEIPKGEMPKGEIPKGEMPKGEMPEEEMSKGEMPEGEMPEEEMSKGEMPKGEMPEEETAKGGHPKEGMAEKIPEHSLPENDMEVRAEKNTGNSMEKTSDLEAESIPEPADAQEAEEEIRPEEEWLVEDEMRDAPEELPQTEEEPKGKAESDYPENEEWPSPLSENPLPPTPGRQSEILFPQNDTAADPRQAEIRREWMKSVYDTPREMQGRGHQERGMQTGENQERGTQAGENPAREMQKRGTQTGESRQNMRSMEIGETFTPFSDGDIAQCRKIHPRDLCRVSRRDCALRNNRFLQYGYYNFGHLLLCKRADGQYILGVPGGYDQQERFMAGMFGFPYFKESHLIKVLKGKGGYWYRLIQGPS